MKKSELRQLIKEEINKTLNKYTSAQEAFNNSNEGDIFRLTVTNPTNKGHFSYTPKNSRTSMTELVKQGNYFVEKEDINKPEMGDKASRKRMYNPKDLDKNNKQIILTKIGSLNEISQNELSDKLANKMKVNLTHDYSKNTMKEKEYKVGFFYSDGDYDTIKVKASSPDNALEKAKDETPFGSKGFKILS